MAKTYRPGLNESPPPKVSIIIANYEKAQALEETVKSIIAQTYPNIELIIVDNASTDMSLEVIRKYECHIARWTSEPDKGIYDAFNKAIAMSSGEWLYFIGSGDRLVGDDAVARAMSASRDADLVYGNVYFYEWGRIYAGKFSRRRFVDHNICQQAIFYHRRLFHMLGLFETAYPFLADYVFNVRCFGDRRVRTRFVDEVIAFFEAGGASATSEDSLLWQRQGTIIRKNLGIPCWVYFLVKYRLGPGALQKVRRLRKLIGQPDEPRQETRRPTAP